MKMAYAMIKVVWTGDRRMCLHVKAMVFDLFMQKKVPSSHVNIYTLIKTVYSESKSNILFILFGCVNNGCIIREL